MVNGRNSKIGLLRGLNVSLITMKVLGMIKSDLARSYKNMALTCSETDNNNREVVSSLAGFQVTLVCLDS